ncbi:MAG: carboxylate-amine ligase [Verrucomicrobiales bacterium]|jgi:carboxylate-amine ligase
MKNAFHMLERFGVELEYMLVRNDNLDVAPVADILLFEAGGDMDGDLAHGEFTWSNELTNHVVELKTTTPISDIARIGSGLHAEIKWFREHAAGRGCTLLPAAMHPWMNPLHETRLWPHGNNEIYQAYDSIFSCKGHGWANVQSTHLNLSFAGDEEFGQLHAAVRVLLPLLPAIAASSPIAEGQLTGSLDSRLEYYRDNQKRVPEIAGMVIPEAVFTEVDYRAAVYMPIAQAMSKLDPGGVLELDFLNSRGAIARFDRGSIEIRVIDIQECPAADLAILQLVVASLRWMIENGNQEELRLASTEELALLLWDTAREGGKALVKTPAILNLCGFAKETSAVMVWRKLLGNVAASLPKDSLQIITTILSRGTLAARIRQAAGPIPSRFQLTDVYRELVRCLAGNQLFLP